MVVPTLTSLLRVCSGWCSGCAGAQGSAQGCAQGACSGPCARTLRAWAPCAWPVGLPLFLFLRKSGAESGIGHFWGEKSGKYNYIQSQGIQLAFCQSNSRSANLEIRVAWKNAAAIWKQGVIPFYSSIYIVIFSTERQATASEAAPRGQEVQ